MAFRNLIAPTAATPIAKALQDATIRSFWPPPASGGQRDAERRFRELWRHIKIVETAAGPKHTIYPGESPKVLRVVRKIVRGLSYALGLPWPVSDERVWAAIRTNPIPEELLAEFKSAYYINGVNDIRFLALSLPGLHSAWELTFLERVRFLAMVGSLDGPLRVDARFRAGLKRPLVRWISNNQ